MSLDAINESFKGFKNSKSARPDIFKPRMLNNYQIQSMLNRGFDDDMVNWYKYYLGNRICSVTIRGITRRRLLMRGVPQGGILSPLAWNIAIDELLSCFDDIDEEGDDIA